MAIRVLCVDDEEGLRSLLQEHLSLEGYDVDVASDGQEAMDALVKKPFDLVLLDLRMPRKDGFEVLRYIRDRHIPARVIMLTGVDDISIASECVKLGASEYLTKPYNFHEMIDTIDRVLAQ